MDPALNRLVKDAAQREREVLSGRDFEPRRERFLAHASQRRLRRRVQRWLAPLGIAAALAIFVAQTLRSPRVLSFEVSGRKAALHDWITTEGSKPLDVAFSDGSRVGLTGEARARVADLHRDGARLVLERGALEAAVVHGQQTSWRFDAGPFSVRVLGTKFRLAWDPRRERFALELAEGQVAISGPNLGSNCVVHAGQRLEIELAAGKGTGACIEVEDELPTPVSDSVATTSSTEATPPQPSEPQAASGQVASGATRAADDDAPARATTSRTGVEQVPRRGTATELMSTADAARFAGKAERATQALLEVRRQFPSSPEASQAAFLLGRIAADQQRAPKRGAEWFAVYLTERPAGAFAPEALGRLLQCQDGSGQLQASRASAASYLERYPTGPYSALARHIVDSGQGGAQRDEGRPAATSARMP